MTAPRIKSAHVLISKKCVNDCVFCATSDKRENLLFVEKDDMVAYMKRMSAAGISDLIFSGVAEPTLDENFEFYLETVRSGPGRGFAGYPGLPACAAEELDFPGSAETGRKE